MDLQLQGKRALITGGSHGIGLAIIEARLAEGCVVALCSRGLARLETAAAALRRSGREALVSQVDVLSNDETVRVTRQIENTWGGVDILVNGACVPVDGGESRSY